MEIKKVENVRTLPKRYFGLHMTEGVAQYNDPDKGDYNIFIGENTLKNMDASFECKPVYVDHKPEIDLENLQEEADGYVIKSFFNQADGKHWVEFMVVSDKGHEAIRNGWRLSNAYVPKSMGPGDMWHGLTFANEITSGEYEHLALVQRPRYDESVIFTPEEFKAYNEQKQAQLNKLSNSHKTGEKTVLKFFKKEKIENALDIENTSTVLPDSKKEVTIAEAIKIADKFMNMHGYANGDHMVKIGEEEMSVNQLSEKYNAMCEEKKANEEKAKADAEKKENEDKDDADMSLDNADDKKDEEKKKENALEEKKKSDAVFNKLKDAEKRTKAVKVVDTVMDKVARGKNRYGSN